MSKRTYITSLTAVNNSNIVTVNDGTDLTNISPGDDLRIDGLPGEAVKAITATQIILERPWALANKTNVKGINVPTADDFREATKLLRDATVLTASNMSAVNSWTTKMGTVEFTDPADPTVTYTVKTIRQLEEDAVVVIDSAIEDANRAEAARDAAIAAKNQAEANKNTAGVSAGNAATKASEAATSASTATTAATTATTKAAEAIVSASSALSEADRAEVEANKAMMAATNLYAMSQAQFEAIRSQNNEEFAASGFVHFGKHHNPSGSEGYVNQGLSTWGDTPSLANRIAIGKKGSLLGTSKTYYAIVNMAGVVFYIDGLNLDQYIAYNYAYTKFPQAPDGKTTYNKSTGVITNHATVAAAFNAQAADPTNVEVVTDRVDMWGFEAWLEEVTTTNPYVYSNGLIQSQAATMDGIATSASARQVTYYAVFDGDTGSKGKGLNFFALTDAQKKKVLANPKNNLYYLGDGRLVQWRLRQRTVAGAGNGDWAGLASSGTLPLSFAQKNVVKGQGKKDLPAISNDNWTNSVFLGFALQYGVKADAGVFGALQETQNAAVNDELYFLVCGTVNRLNQGAYHPSFNSSGARKWQHISGDTSQFWYEVSAPTNVVQADCFRDATSTSGGAGKGYRNNTGYIGGSGSGRPDGRFYDAIYADGQGGVCRDMRYSAYGVDAVDFAEADQRVKNGTYRGFELLKFTKVKDTGGVPQSSGSWDGGTKRVAYFTGNFFNLISGTLYNGKGFIVSKSSSVVRGVASISYSSSTGLTAVNLEGPLSDTWVLDSYIVFPFEDKSSIGGSFLQTDVIGNPANILATPALANGWQGSWIPVIPDGTTKEFLASRKNISAVGRVSQYTTNNGGSWATGSWNIDAIKNSTTSFEPANRITIITYQAFAKQTKNVVNAVVDGGITGIGHVSVSCYWEKLYGGLLLETLLGKIATSNKAAQYEELMLSKLGIDRSTGKLHTSSNYPIIHQTLGIIDPANNSPAVKALNYNVNLNQQAFIQYAYTELKHNGTNWGDDGKVTIVDNQSTKIDLNGNTVLVGTAKLKEPIGWIRNKV